MKQIKIKIAVASGEEVLPLSERSRAQRKRKKIITRIVTVISVLFVLTLLVKAVLGDRGFFSVLRIRSEYASLYEEVKQRADRNARLVKEIDRLKNDSYYKEKLARERLGFLKEGEIVFLFPDADKDKSSFPNKEGESPFSLESNEESALN